MSVPRACRAGLLLLGLGLLLPACTTTVPIHSTRPGPVAVGAARHLVILDGSGRRSARETVFLELARQARSDSWFTVDDLSEDGHHVRVAGGSVKVRPRFPLEEESAGLRIDVHEWAADRTSHTLEVENEEGDLEKSTVRGHEGRVVLGVTLFDAWGHALLSEREYEGLATADSDEAGREEVIERAAAEAVSRFLADVTPHSVTQQVRLDDDDAGQQPILQTARDGHLELAARRMETYVEDHPEEPSAAYNLAVLLDALGDRHEALAWYDRAIELRYRDHYATARAACARRIADAAALLPYQPPANVYR
jgi:hypothetical protein